MNKIIVIIIFVVVFPLDQLAQAVSDEGIAQRSHWSIGGQADSLEDATLSKGSQPNSISTNANFPNDYGQVSITKTAKANYTSFYLLNKTYNVKVQIKGIGRTIENITIKEIIDPQLKADISSPLPQIFDPFNALYLEPINQADQTLINNESKINKKSKDYYYLNQSNKTIYMQLSRLEPKRRIEYNYNISSNKTGVFETMTIIRIGGSASKIQDIDVPLNVEMKPPEFYVYLDREASFASANKNFTVTYNIIHKSGWCDEPFKQNVSFKLSHDGEYEIFHDGKCYHGGANSNHF